MDYINHFIDKCFTTLAGCLALLDTSEERQAKSHNFIIQMGAVAFEKNSAYYKHNNKSYLNREVREWLAQKEGAWRDALKEGDRVDVQLSRDQNKRKVLKQWRQAVIDAVIEDGDCLYLSFPNFEFNTVKKNRYSLAIAPF